VGVRLREVAPHSPRRWGDVLGQETERRVDPREQPGQQFSRLVRLRPTRTSASMHQNVQRTKATSGRRSRRRSGSAVASRHARGPPGVDGRWSARHGIGSTQESPPDGKERRVDLLTAVVGNQRVRGWDPRPGRKITDARHAVGRGPAHQGAEGLRAPLGAHSQMPASGCPATATPLRARRSRGRARRGVT
jgi:hypothetical protein